MPGLSTPTFGTEEPTTDLTRQELSDALVEFDARRQQAMTTLELLDQAGMKLSEAVDIILQANGGW